MGANPKDGVIYFLDRRSPQTSLRSLSRNRYDPSKLPQLRSSSDIAWAIWNRVAVSNMKNVKMFMSRDIVNDDTERIIHRILRKQFGLEKVKAWPGVDFEITWEPGREAETEAALALIGSSFQRRDEHTQSLVSIGCRQANMIQDLPMVWAQAISLHSTNANWELRPFRKSRFS